MMAYMRTIPKSVPATREETMSPAPTPVTAMTMPGPTCLSRLPRVEGAAILAARSSVTSVMLALPTLANKHIVLDTVVT